MTRVLLVIICLVAGITFAQNGSASTPVRFGDLTRRRLTFSNITLTDGGIVFADGTTQGAAPNSQLAGRVQANLGYGCYPLCNSTTIVPFPTASYSCANVSGGAGLAATVIGESASGKGGACAVTATAAAVSGSFMSFYGANIAMHISNGGTFAATWCSGSDISSVGFWGGLTEVPGNTNTLRSATPSFTSGVDYVAFRYINGTDTTYKCCVGNGATDSCVDSGVTVSASQCVNVEISVNWTSSTSSVTTWKINGQQVCPTQTGWQELSGIWLYPTMAGWTGVAATRQWRFGAVRFQPYTYDN